MNSTRTLLGLSVVVLALAGAACGPTDTVCVQADLRPECMNTATNPVVKIVVTEDNVSREVNLDAQESFEICYRARAQFKNGNGADITAAAIWTLDRPEMGTFPPGRPCVVTGTNLRSGGIVKVQASLGSTFGFASLIIKLVGQRENDGIGAPAFGGAPNTDGAAKPRVVYPLDDSMHARNVNKMNFQFFSGGNVGFRARFKSSQLDYNLYFKPTACNGDRCQWQVPKDQWQLIALTNGGATATVTLSGVGADGRVAQGDPITVSFSPDDVNGGLYYFSTSVQGILRLPFAKNGTADQATPFIIANSNSNPKDCAGCHAITQDGTKITATYGHGDDFLGIASGSNAEDFGGGMNGTPPLLNPRTSNQHSNFQWFNNDGTKLISNFNGELILRDGNTGMPIATLPRGDVGERAVMPEWSHTGDRIVFVRLLKDSRMFYDVATCCPKKPGGDWLITDGGEIVTMNYEDGNFSNPRVIVGAGESGEFHYYPSFSPVDDAWIVFNTGTKPGFSPVAQDDTAGFSYGVPKNLLVSYDQKTSVLRMVRSTGGGIIELAKATFQVGKTTSWPKFTPFVQKGGNLMFFTFSSKMDYGFVVTGGRQPQIWMAAVDLSRIDENAGDPSYAPFWLPFQDVKESNHIGIWTTKIICEKENSKCGAGEFCSNGECLPNVM